MTDPRYIPYFKRKPYQLKGAKRVGRIGLKREIGMVAARKAYTEKFGYLEGETQLGPCQLCRRVDAFHVHHKLKRSQGGNESAGNLIALCPFHHAFIHRPENKAFLRAVKECDANISNGYSLGLTWAR
jgi:hypothetical protein